MAVAQAIEVLPTPPLPVKKRKRGGCSRKFMTYVSIVSAAFAARAAAASGLCFGCRLCNASPACQLDTVGVTSRKGDFSINQNQRQRFLARAFQKALHDGVVSESHRLLGEIETLYQRPVLFGPGCISRKADQSLIDIDAANACAAAQRRIKYLYGFHF